MVDENERVVLARKAPWSMVGHQWTGNEPAGLDDVSHAEALGAVWEGEELVTYSMGKFKFDFEHWDFEYLEDSD
jgi:hypothetical protein